MLLNSFLSSMAPWLTLYEARACSINVDVSEILGLFAGKLSNLAMLAVVAKYYARVYVQYESNFEARQPWRDYRYFAEWMVKWAR